MRRRSCFAAASLLLGGAVLHAAEIKVCRVEVEVLADGSYRTHEHMELLLQSVGDVAAWSPLAIPLDTNRTLESLTGTIAFPDGSARKLTHADLDTAGDVDPSLLASSASQRLIRLTGVPAGSSLALDYTTLTHPYYPTGEVAPLRSAAASTDRVEVSVRCFAPRFRYRLTGEPDGLEVKPTPDGVTVTGSGLSPLTLPANAPDRSSVAPALRFGWGREGSWEDVGRWWGGLLADVPAPGSRLAAACRELALSGRPAPEVIGAVLGYIHRHVRYVAVELGIGGWKPIDAETTLEHGWGDCKGLALLTATMLRHAGIDAVPAAAAATDGALVDPAFPSLEPFDHVVVAVPAASLAGDGLLDDSRTYAMIDPTQTTPGQDIFPVYLMGRRLLLLGGTHPGLITAAIRPERELRRLRVALAVAADGSARGTAAFDMVGSAAGWWLDAVRTKNAGDLALAAQEVLSAYLPTAVITDVGWARGNARDSTVELRSNVVLPEFLAVGRSSMWFEAGGPTAMPAAGSLAGRSVPFVATPQVAEAVWTLQLPAGWRLVEPANQNVSNSVGAFAEKVIVGTTTVQVVRHTELRQRCVADSAIPLLRDVAAAEHRGVRQRLIVELQPAAPVTGAPAPPE